MEMETIVHAILVAIEHAIIYFSIKLALMTNEWLQNTYERTQIARVIFAFPFYSYVAIAPFRASEHAGIPLEPVLLEHRLNVCSFD